MKLKLIISFIMFSLFSNNSGAQKKVESGAYNLMLKTLLSHNVHEVSVEQAKKSDNVVFIDTRELEEYNVSHIKDAVWVGYNDFSINRLKDIPKNKKLIVYCSVGKRSEDVTQKLQNAGYKDVANLYGGLFEWVNQGNPVYKGDTPTQKVHAYSKTWGIWLNEGEKVYSDK